ncbi:MAG: hypothetical protein FWH26_11495, partial [Oscillospiraceae bacterium]|nr:hypothetical protein [Oscillospiraceae bacterium]
CGTPCGQLVAVAFFYAGFGLAISLSHQCCPQVVPHARMWPPLEAGRLLFRAARPFRGEEASKPGLYPAVICCLL